MADSAEQLWDELPSLGGELFPGASRAECTQRGDPDIFYSKSEANERAAKAICGNCVARLACLEYALETDQALGIWGGTNEDERRVLQRRGKRIIW